MSTFGYVGGSPLNNIDPTGELAFLVIPGVCAAGGCEALAAGLGLATWMATPAGQEATKSAADALSDKMCPSSDECQRLTAKISAHLKQ